MLPKEITNFVPKETIKSIKKDLKDGYQVRYLGIKYGITQKTVRTIKESMK